MRKKIQNLFTKIAASFSIMIISTINAFADLKITPDISVDDFNNLTGDKIASTVLWIVFFLLRLVGAVVLIWGIYGMITAKKDGDADQINVAMAKLIFGACFLGLPWLLSQISVISVA